ncbi:hypothetical protein C8A03DRAFT_29645 [Achaetomium macrosporum]|uniref:Uncharacterized protein n=1 Tax=Achaetomium macrosporum TaxID=79813 RepID=A0AAN7CJ17_9PEZI|nr:hypothetical protein C8A03DRAFT_29645 [Achaetomium macrosporum]
MHLQLLTGSVCLLFKLAAAQCVTSTTTQVGIATTVSDLAAFQSSMDVKYSKSGGEITGNTVFIHTSVYTYPGGSFTGYGIYESDALASEGFSFVTHTVTETSCETTEPPETDEPSETGHTLPPSPTGSICSPHEDNWHCEASPTTSNTAGGSEASSEPEGPSATCTPHEDHWHCPPGVASPTYPPSEVPSTLTRAPSTTTAAPATNTSRSAPSDSAVSTAGAAGKPVALSALGLGAFFSFVYGFL